ncbi:MAG: DNA polymerase [Deltaproteobacteria bacterium]|nr:DNA polymerase [Deltaproteobacteria bacterium]
MNQADFYQNYEIRLARALYRIEKRGMLMDMDRLKALRVEVSLAIDKEIAEIESEIKRPVVLSKAEAKGKASSIWGNTSEVVVLQSPSQVTDLIESLGIKLKKSRKTKKPTSDSAALYSALAESGSPVIHALLKIRELGKIRSVDIDAPLHNDTLYGAFRASGTDTGRRSSSANVFGLGTNLQNLPKWSDWAKKFRSCITARPGKIFIQCDQKSAEDWVINALIADISGNERGMNELRSGINRHKKLAGFVFGLPESQIAKESIQYYLAKRVRYAGSYGMWKWRMAETLASEGKIVHPDECGVLLDRFHLAEPDIKNVFQAWIENELRTKRELTTPLGRCRQFFELRPLSNNSDVFRKGYAQIPQSTVGDNTGMAIVFIEDRAPILLGESHDSVLGEIDDNEESVRGAAQLFAEAFDRKLRFSVRGYEINIPIETEIGYNLGHLHSCDFATTGWIPIYRELAQAQKQRTHSTGGVLQQF